MGLTVRGSPQVSRHYVRQDARRGTNSRFDAQRCGLRKRPNRLMCTAANVCKFAFLEVRLSTMAGGVSFDISPGGEAFGSGRGLQAIRLGSIPIARSSHSVDGNGTA